MSTPMVSSFYDINDVIQQSKLRPASLDLRQRFERKQTNPLLSRRHSTNSTALTVPIGKQAPISPANSNFFPMPPSPKEQIYGNMSPALLRERAQSASLQEEIEAQHRKRGSSNSSRYKTELCRPFEENGTCKYGDKCQFAHGMHELRGLNRHPKYKTEYCRTYHTIGFCPYGPRCHFIHNDEEKRLPSLGSDRPNSMSSLGDSTSSSPLIDAAPSPFGNSLTPPTSPGYGGDVFLFDESHINRAPLAVCGQNFGHMATIAESLYPVTEAGDFHQPRSPPGMERSERMSVPVAALKRSAAVLSRDNALLGTSDMRGDCGSYVSTGDSAGSGPPSPVDSLDGARDSMGRLPVFGFIR